MCTIGGVNKWDQLLDKEIFIEDTTIVVIYVVGVAGIGQDKNKIAKLICNAKTVYQTINSGEFDGMILDEQARQRAERLFGLGRYVRALENVYRGEG